MSVIAIIPCRSGSKGVPGKNINLLSGFPLIAYSIAAAKMLPEISRIIVSTDSPQYAEIAKNYGAEVPFFRPEDISGDKSSDLDFMLHAMKWFEANENETPEYWMHLRPTTPLRDPKVMKDAITLMLKSTEATSLRSGHLAPESPFKWLMKGEQNYFVGLREDLTPETVNLPRQSFPPVYIPDGYVDIVRRSCVISSNSLHGNKMLVFESPNCSEIDTQDDFNYIEYQLEKESSPVYQFLKDNYTNK